MFEMYLALLPLDHSRDYDFADAVSAAFSLGFVSGEERRCLPLVALMVEVMGEESVGLVLVEEVVLKLVLEVLGGEMALKLFLEVLCTELEGWHPV